MILAPPPSPAITSEDAGTTTIVDQVGLQNTVPQITHGDDRMNERNENPNNRLTTTTMEQYSEDINFQVPTQQDTFAQPVTASYAHPVTQQMTSNPDQYRQMTFPQAETSRNETQNQTTQQQQTQLEPNFHMVDTALSQVSSRKEVSQRTPKKRRTLVDYIGDDDYLQNTDIIANVARQLFKAMENDPVKMVQARLQIIQLISSLHVDHISQ